MGRIPRAVDVRVFREVEARHAVGCIVGIRVGAKVRVAVKAAAVDDALILYKRNGPVQAGDDVPHKNQPEKRLHESNERRVESERCRELLEISPESKHAKQLE